MVTTSHLRRLAELEAARASALARREFFVVFENFDFAFVDPWPAPKFTLVRQRGETAAGFEIRILKQIKRLGRVYAVMAEISTKEPSEPWRSSERSRNLDQGSPELNDRLRRSVALCRSAVSLVRSEHLARWIPRFGRRRTQAEAAMRA
jgi:hypothetical protein